MDPVRTGPPAPQAGARTPEGYTDEILDGIDDVFYVLDEEGNLQWWNESASEVARCSEADFEASHALDFFEGDDVDVVADGI